MSTLLSKSDQEFPITNVVLKRHQLCASAGPNKTSKNAKVKEKLPRAMATQYLKVIQAKLRTVSQE